MPNKARAAREHGAGSRVPSPDAFAVSPSSHEGPTCLRLELLQREINRLIQERDALGGQISSVVKDTLEREEVTADLASVRPIFENFQLKGLEVPEKSLRESRKELENSGE